MTRAKELLDAATPLPWDLGERVDYDPLIQGGAAHGPWPIICPPLGAPIACLDERPGIEPPERNAADAALIVYAVNTLPAYEAAVKALERINDLAGQKANPNVHQLSFIGDVAREALRRLQEPS